MNPPDQNPKLPNWLFIVTDVALIAAAAWIAYRSPQPMPAPAMLAIVVCVGLGAIVGLVPLIVRFERQKNEALDERQRALESLARTVSASAEQISIATGGLHEIAEMAQKNLRHAEHLPHKLQEKIAEFQAQLASATDAEKEELERELLSLRTTESERLESVSQRIAKSAAEWSKLEAAAHQHLTAANEALAKISLGTASAIGKAQVAAEQALSQARVEAARSVGDASGQALRAIESAKTSSLAELDTKLAAVTSSIVDRMGRELDAKLASATQMLDEKIGRLESAARQMGSASTFVSAPAIPLDLNPPPAPDASGNVPATSAPSGEAATEESIPAAGSDAPSPKRIRKPRRDDSAVVPPAVPSPTSTSIDPGTTTLDSTNREIANGSADILPIEPPPVPAEKIPEITPVAPHTVDPFAGETANGSPAATDAVDPPKSARKRAPARKPDAIDEPALGLDLDDTTGQPAAGLAERVISSDGATRLLVTAYIGIGNRLYIRGEGPGLSWEKGVPLQFVSIGKWRWETNDANAPVQFKLYKNDDVECSALGNQQLDPGHQQELRAPF